MSVHHPFVLHSLPANIHAAGSEDRLAVCAQGDGVHVLDIPGLHVKYSHTLGPSAAFSSPPLSVGDRIYAVLGNAVALWDDAPGKTEHKKSNDILPEGESAHALYALPNRVLVLSSQGTITLLDDKSLDQTKTHSFASSVIHSTLIQSPRLLFIASTASPSEIHIRLISIDEADSIDEIYTTTISFDSTTITDISFSSSGVLSILTSTGSWHVYQLPLRPSSSSSSTSPSSPPTNLTTPITLHPQSLSLSSPKTITITPLTSSHILLASPAPKEDLIHIHIWDLQYSLLLSAITIPIPPTQTQTQTQTFVQLVPISQTDAVKSSTTRVTGQVGLIITQENVSASSPVKPKKSKSQSQPSQQQAQSTMVAVQSSVYVIPYTVPTSSTIAAALAAGKTGQTSKWLKSSTATDSSMKKDAPVAPLLKKLAAGVKDGRSHAVLGALTEWVEKNPLDYNTTKTILSTILSTLPPKSPGYSPESVRYLIEKKVVSSGMVSSSSLFSGTGAGRGLLGCLRAQGDWETILLCFRHVPDLTEGELVETLKVVVGGYLGSSGGKAKAKGGKKRGGDGDDDSNEGEGEDDDEEEQDKEKEDEDDMDVDAPTTATAPSVAATPPLPTFLRLLLAYPTSRAPLLTSIKTTLISPSASASQPPLSSSQPPSQPWQYPPIAYLNCPLEVLDRWLVRRNKMEERILPGRKQVGVKGGVWVLVGGKEEEKEGKDEVPSLDQIVSFVTTLLDASFLTILLSTSSLSSSASASTSAHPSSITNPNPNATSASNSPYTSATTLFKLLKSIRAHLGPELAYGSTVEKLRGLVEPFAVAQGRVVRDAAAAGASGKEKQGKAGKEGSGKEKDKKSLKRNVVGLDVGMYRLEELVL